MSCGAEGASAGGFLSGRCVAVNSNTPIESQDVFACARDSEMVLRSKTKKGSFDFGEVPRGRYSLAFINPWYDSGDEMERSGWVSGVVVEDGRRTVVDLAGRWDVLLRGHFRRGTTWSGDFVEFTQSFIALGRNLIKVSVAVASQPKRIDVSVHRNGPEGPQTGPTRSFHTMHEGHVFWAGGEAPLVPGERYFVRLRSHDGSPWNPYLCGIGDGYADGMAYFNGVPRPRTDLAINISTDSDGLTTAYAGPPGFDVERNNLGTPVKHAAGQTFVATGRNVIVAAVPMAIAGIHPESETIGVMRVALREGGPDGCEIAAARNVPYANNWQGVALWAPGAAPTVPGETYYLDVSLPEGAEFFSYAGFDRYPHGTAFRDGIADLERDICARILCGPTEPDSVNLYDVDTTPGDSPESVVVSFRTNRPVTAAVLTSHGLQVGSDRSAVDHQMAVPLAGVSDRFRIECADGTVSPWYIALPEGGVDLAVLDYPVPPDEMREASELEGRNLLTDGGFEETDESGLPAGWNVGGKPHGSVTEGEHGIAPPEGKRVFGWSRMREPDAPRTEFLRTDDVFQEVATRPGESYRTEAWIYTGVEHGNPGDPFDGRDGQVRVRLFARDAGEEDAGEATQSYCTNNEWLHIKHYWTARSATTEVGASLFQWYDLVRSSAYVDEIRLTENPRADNASGGAP